MKRFVACMLLVGLAACSSGSSNSGSSTTPSTPPLTPTSEVFTGTVPVGGSDFHSFTVSLSNGQVTANLTAAGPPPTISMGLGLGAPSNGTCALFQGGTTIAPAGDTARLVGNGFTAGTYCVLVADVGNQLADVTYSVTVTHY